MRQLPLRSKNTGNITMNKHVLALSTALSILVFTPAFAQEQTAAAPGTIDCTLPENASNAACVNQQQNTQGQTGQTTGQTGQQQMDQQQQTGQTGTEGTDTGTVTTTTTTQQGTQGTAELFVPAEQLNSAELMSASDYIGKTVYDQAGNNIGEVNDLIVSGDGNIEAVILGVGGFLGIGEKNVALPFEAFDFTAGAASASASGASGAATSTQRDPQTTGTVGSDRSASTSSGAASSGGQRGSMGTMKPERIVLKNMTKADLEAAPSFGQQGGSSGASSTSAPARSGSGGAGSGGAAHAFGQRPGDPVPEA